jgi:hypothetical protein
MVMSPAGLGTNKHCVGEDQRQFTRKRITNGATNVERPTSPLVEEEEERTKTLFIDLDET